MTSKPLQVLIPSLHKQSFSYKSLQSTVFVPFCCSLCKFLTPGKSLQNVQLVLKLSFLNIQRCLQLYVYRCTHTHTNVHTWIVTMNILEKHDPMKYTWKNNHISPYISECVCLFTYGGPPLTKSRLTRFM